MLRKIDNVNTSEFTPCYNSEHEPPSHIVLDPGTWEHTCPGCGKKQTFIVNFNQQLFRSATDHGHFQECEPFR